MSQRESIPQERYVFPDPTPSLGLGQGLNRAIDRGQCSDLVRIRTAVE